MLFASLLILATALLPLSESRAIAIPSSQIPGYKLIYTNLRALPGTYDTLEPVGDAASPRTPATCASVCASIPNCKFFAIYTPLSGLNDTQKVCNYYPQADPYQHDDGTRFTKQVRELCGYQKDIPVYSEPYPTKNGTAIQRRSGSYDQSPSFQHDTPYSVNNGTNATTVTESRKISNPIPYYPNKAEYQPTESCGAICKGYLALRNFVPRWI